MFEQKHCYISTDLHNLTKAFSFDPMTVYCSYCRCDMSF